MVPLNAKKYGAPFDVAAGKNEVVWVDIFVPENALSGEYTGSVKAGGKTLKLVLWAIFGLRITDANTPFRLIKASVLGTYVKRIPKDFNLSNVMLTVLLLDAKEPVKFVPITFRPRQGGVNSINLRRITRIGRQAVKDFRVIKREMKEADRGEKR